MPDTDRVPLYVRLTGGGARRLDDAAARLGAHKKDIVGGLIDRYVDPDTPEGLAALAALTTPHRVVQTRVGEPTVGHASFRPAAPAEVLTLPETAALLGAAEADVEALADAGELPGRRVGGQWRFSRAAVLRWLGGD